ncbi:MAG: DUF4231 domain-containing protein [Anaerolineae bacterium]|nr:DUF4231 domain-containing protein [Anaerolineae bacterium]MDW8173546.1 DUF4231 domain-containing protein [Anaerolineae bacterium]
MSQPDLSTSPHAIQPPPPPPAPDPAVLATPAPLTYAPYLDKQDPALLTAWRRLEDYSFVSTDRKKAYVKLRSAVIWTGFATSALAVLSAYVPDWLAVLGVMGLPSDLIVFAIRAALVTLPIVSVGLMTYANQFASSVAWIEYRISAEIIRQHIYRYRMGAGRFRGMDRQQAQRQLLAVVKAADERLARRNVTIPDIRKPEAYEVEVERINDRLAEGDDGFAPLSSEVYISARIEPQINWYVKRLQDDYKALRENRVIALTISGIGAVIAALLPSGEGLVAITTALGVAFGLRNDTRMFGATYGVYHVAAQRLQMMIAEWRVLTQEEREDPAKLQDFVARVEDILYEEGKLWRQTAIQLQSNSEEALQNMLRNQPSERDDKSNKLMADDDDLDALIGPPPSVGAASVTGAAPLLPDESDPDAIRWEQPPQASNGKAAG